LIVLYRSFGNHSNRLFQNLHFEAFCIEFGIEYANPTLLDMSKYFISPVDTKYFYKALLLRTVVNKGLSKVGLFRNLLNFNYDIDSKNELIKTNPDQDYYVEGWGFRVHDLTAKYQDLFIDKYSLKEEYYINNRLYKKIQAIDRDTTSIIGVHIRRGDYKTHQGGKYYFNDEVYKKYIRQMQKDIKEKLSKDSIIIIFSDEITGFNENSNIIISKNDWYVDHYLMSTCDYLIGPPSTFTLWASYIGKNKYFHFTNDSGKIDIGKFAYFKG